MANFSDFVSSIGKKAPTTVSVSDLLRAQSRAGSDEDKSTGKLKDIAEMFISAEKTVGTELETFGNKEVVQELSKLNKGFSSYADNLSMMQYYLKKFSDESTDINAQDAEELKRLVDQNKQLVSSINEVRTQDKDFNQKLTQIEKDRDFLFRNQGIMDVEQQRIQSKYNQTSAELWGDIAADIDNLKGTVEGEFKQAIIEGVGGPIGTLGMKVFLPGLKAVKDSVLGQKLGEGVSRLTGLFKKGNDVSEDISESQDSTSNIIEASNEGVKESLDELQQDDGSSLEDIMNDTLDATNDIVLPSASLMKRKLIVEDRAKKALNKKKGDGIFYKIYDATISGNTLLRDISLGIKDEKGRLDSSYEAVTDGLMFGERMADMSEDEMLKVAERASVQERILEDIRKSSEYQGRKIDVINSFNDSIFQRDEELLEIEEEHREEDLKVQYAILDELDTLGRTGGSGDGLGGLFAGSFLGQALPKKGMLNWLKTALPFAGTIAGVGLGLDKFLEGIGMALGVGSGGLVTDEETGQLVYKESDEKLGLISTIKGLPGMLADFWVARVQEGDWSGTVWERAEEIRSQREEDKKFEKLIKSGVEAADILHLSKEEIKFRYDPNNEQTQQNLNSLLEDLFGNYAVTPRAVEVNGDLYRFNVGGEVEADDITEDDFIQILKDMVAPVGVSVSEVNTAVEDVRTDLDLEMDKVERESMDLSANVGVPERAREQETKEKPVVIQQAAQNTPKKQKLDEISMLPEDNFGLVLVNSGVNII